jgi:hypothetical protein
MSFRMRSKMLSAWIVCAACLFGCTSSSPVNKSEEGTKKGDAEIRQAFSALQAAIKVKDADKIWELLARESQADADREAKAALETYGKLPEKERGDYEKKMKLASKDLLQLSGKLYLQSKPFHGKHHEIPDSKVEAIQVTGDIGSLKFVEEDGDKITVDMVKEKGAWKFSLPIPKAPEK